MASTASKSERVRISIRYKVLLVISAVLLLAMGTYLYLATSLFTKDKLAYIYDLNASLAESLAEQTRTSLTVLVKELAVFSRELGRSGNDANRQAKELFEREPSLVQVAIFSGVGAHDIFTHRQRFLNDARLPELGLHRAQLDAAWRDDPVPLSSLVQPHSRDYVYIANSSLPPDAALLTVAFELSDGRVIGAEVSHQMLLRVFGGSRLHQTMLIDARGIVLAHPNGKEVIDHADLSRNALVRAALTGKVDEGVKEYTGAKGTAYLGAYARVGIGGLWVLTQIPRSEALRASRELIKRSVLFAIAILLAAFIVSIFFSRYLAAPIRRLQAATESIGRGKLDINVEVRSRDEIGALADAFNRMAKALKQTQAQLIQSEKMAAFGQLGAGITHEVKNPMTGIVGFAQLAQRRVDDPEKTLELLKLIETEGLRCRDILVNFLKFARAGGDDFEVVELNTVVDEAARILRHQLSVNGVKLHLEMGGGVPPVRASAQELKQVILNLAMNAQQAMPDGGNVWITTTTADDGAALIRVRDDGAGIPEAIRTKIFEPFFTTKPAGKGTGLGLSVSFGIIRNHDGSLDVESTPGEGSCFTIRLPAAPAAASPPAAQAAGSGSA